MLIDGQPSRTLEPLADGAGVRVIDQRLLPHRLQWVPLRGLEDAAEAIGSMWVRGAPLIGVTAAYGMALQARVAADDAALQAAKAKLDATRPTAVNLAWATQRVLAEMQPLPVSARAETAWNLAAAMADEDVAVNRAIGEHGLALLRQLPAVQAGRRLNLLTHCNAGWLATVDWGTALAPVYAALAQGIDIHVWVDETRPRNQGAALTAWELVQQGAAHTVIADNAGGHLMQRGEVDIVIVGADRVAANGDVCNKIGTYLKALAARDCGIPFHAAVPLSTLDLGVADGLRSIPIEHRAAREVTHIAGRDGDGQWREVQLVPDGSDALNPAFDVTPARLVSGLITERGCLAAEASALRAIAKGS